MKIINILIEKFKHILENPGFEQKYYSRTSTGLYTIGYDSIRLLNWLAYYDRSNFENKIFYDLIASVLSCLTKIS